MLDITEQKQTEHALRSSAEQLTALSRRLVEIQETERRQLSRELHDRVGQNLTALSINLDILGSTLADERHAEQRARLNDSSALLESTVDSIENVMAELRPPMLDDYGLLPALHWYAKDFSKRTGIEVSVAGNESAERPAPEMEIALFRIAQEALTNVAKHAGATRVEIVLEHPDSRCVMTVTDNGIGVEPAQRGAGHAPWPRHGDDARALAGVGGRFSVQHGRRRRHPGRDHASHDDHACSSRTITASWPRACATSSARSRTCEVIGLAENGRDAVRAAVERASGHRAHGPRHAAPERHRGDAPHTRALREHARHHALDVLRRGARLPRAAGGRDRLHHQALGGEGARRRDPRGASRRPLSQQAARPTSSSTTSSTAARRTIRSSA